MQVIGFSQRWSVFATLRLLWIGNFGTVNNRGERFEPEFPFEDELEEEVRQVIGYNYEVISNIHLTSILFV